MKALLKTLLNIWQPDPNEPEPVWKRSDWIAPWIISAIIAARIGFWPI